MTSPLRFVIREWSGGGNEAVLGRELGGDVKGPDDGAHEGVREGDDLLRGALRCVGSVEVRGYQYA